MKRPAGGTRRMRAARSSQSGLAKTGASPFKNGLSNWKETNTFLKGRLVFAHPGQSRVRLLRIAAEGTARACERAPSPSTLAPAFSAWFAYKALIKYGVFAYDIKHYKIRSLCIQSTTKYGNVACSSVLSSALYAKSPASPRPPPCPPP